MGHMTVITTAPCLCVWHLGDLEVLSKFMALQQQQWKLTTIWNCPHLTDKKTKFQRGKMTCSQARTQPQALEMQATKQAGTRAQKSVWTPQDGASGT